MRLNFQSGGGIRGFYEDSAEMGEIFSGSEVKGGSVQLKEI
jgi:hypothetical protein